MRKAFLEALVEQAAADERIFLLTGDLGWSVLEPFAERFPDRFINAGVAEQNLVGIATGLAQSGYVPFTYSIATFLSMRPYEQIRNGPLLHRLAVRLVGVGGGYAYGHSGPTHHALEDLAIARIQPGMTAIAPADPAQTRTVLEAIRNVPGPVYLRVGKGNNPPVPGLDGRFVLGEPSLAREGSDVLLLATGAVAVNAADAAERLAAEGVSAAVAVQAHLPFEPTKSLTALLARFRVVVSVEEGYPAGGLGALAAEAIAGRGLDCRLRALGVRTPPGQGAGATSHLQREAGLTGDAVAAAARAALRGDDPPGP